MENLNRVLLENVLPAHVAEHFLARSLKNEVGRHGAVGGLGPGPGGRGPFGHLRAAHVREWPQRVRWETRLAGFWG